MTDSAYAMIVGKKMAFAAAEMLTWITPETRPHIDELTEKIWRMFEDKDLELTNLVMVRLLAQLSKRTVELKGFEGTRGEHSMVLAVASTGIVFESDLQAAATATGEGN